VVHDSLEPPQTLATKAQVRFCTGKFTNGNRRREIGVGRPSFAPPLRENKRPPAAPAAKMTSIRLAARTGSLQERVVENDGGGDAFEALDLRRMVDAVPCSRRGKVRGDAAAEKRCGRARSCPGQTRSAPSSRAAATGLAPLCLWFPRHRCFHPTIRWRSSRTHSDATVS